MRSFENLTLQTERLRLRPLRASDAPALFAIFSDPKVMRYWNTVPWASIDDAHKLVARDAVAMASGEFVRLGIERKDEGVLLGFCTLFDFHEESRRAEIGYGLAYSAWGRGYMHEALVALVRYGFDELALNRIEADIDPRNDASRKSLERLGFQKEGHLRDRWIVGGEVSDSGLYGLLLSDWKKFEGVRGEG